MMVEKAVQKTLQYSYFFGYKPNFQEVHYWLVSSKIIHKSKIPKNLVPKISQAEQAKKEKRKILSLKKKKLALKLLSFAKKFPFVWFVGITGSVAANNASDSDDIDILIITAPYTLWLVRPLFLFILSLKGIRRGRFTSANKSKNLICPNLWLDFFNIAIQKNRQNLYTAREVLQIYPLYDNQKIHPLFINQNSWVKNFFANTYHFVSPTLNTKMSIVTPHYLLSPLNYLFYLLQVIIMFPKKNSVEISTGKAFFHSTNYQNRISRAIDK